MVYNNRIAIRCSGISMRRQGDLLLLWDMLRGREMEGTLHVVDRRVMMPFLLGRERLLGKHVML